MVVTVFAIAGSGGFSVPVNRMSYPIGGLRSRVALRRSATFSRLASIAISSAGVA